LNIPVGVLRPKTKFPPLVPDAEFIFFEREFQSRYVVVYLPGGNSYDLDAEDLRGWLKTMGLPLDVVGYVWNFHTAQLHVPTGKYVWISKSDLYAITGNRPLEVGIY